MDRRKTPALVVSEPGSNETNRSRKFPLKPASKTFASKGTQAKKATSEKQEAGRLRGW